MTMRAVCGRSGSGPGRFPLPYGEPSTIGTRAAASRGAACASPRGITSATGRTAGRPRSRTSRFSVVGTIARCTKRVTRSRVGPTGRSTSGGRTAGRCPTCRCLSRCPEIRSALSARLMKSWAFVSALGRRALAGSGSAWMWDGRSTSCIPGRCPSRAFPRERLSEGRSGKGRGARRTYWLAPVYLYPSNLQPHDLRSERCGWPTRILTELA